MNQICLAMLYICDFRHHSKPVERVGRLATVMEQATLDQCAHHCEPGSPTPTHEEIAEACALKMVKLLAVALRHIEAANSPPAKHLAKQVLRSDGSLHELGAQLLLGVGYFNRLCILWREEHVLGSTGRCQQFLATAAAVTVMSELDGGPTYGLPQHVAAGVIKALHSCSHKEILLTWLGTYMPRSGQMPRFVISRPVLYKLYMRASCVGIDNAQRATKKHPPAGASGGGGGGGSADISAGGPSGDDGAASSGEREPSAVQERAGWCEVALVALTAANSSRRSPRYRGRSAQGEWFTSGSTSRPLGWWHQVVRALQLAALAAPGRPRRDDGMVMASVSLVKCVILEEEEEVVAELPVPLPATPPPDLATGLSAGFVPSLEHLLRQLFEQISQDGDSLPDIFSHEVDLLACLLSWPWLGCLMAYGDQRQVAALIATLSEAMWESCVDEIHQHCALTGGWQGITGGGNSSSSSSSSSGGPIRRSLDVIQKGLMLTSCEAPMRVVLGNGVGIRCCRETKPLQVFASLFGEGGLRPDAQLMAMVRSVHAGTAAAVLPLPPSPSFNKPPLPPSLSSPPSSGLRLEEAPPLPSLGVVRAVLRTCDFNNSCCNLSGAGEADLELQEFELAARAGLQSGCKT
ncbi:hypothetical protein VOLCADRAFT_93535 [Volvox carteri f. nagariensis]|uniref:Uncharacterized protein n=1 Tax=Volvox carteri f. nagariensis TaxID=3068 RepID=D8U2D5_VOLCA|nr:uncharacterized protein VOLCADRAFT_93535 [Volvox carteri f. nagariensis]EFJ46045.1 hypothetical protein VOLCADRAFT_93535 [Volvox carteri f. nagariensis]|eukprot:XP_002952795.1 hypothetical protein VOLCADRAFT_93535 [Volvox carteri f. nagariensis]